MGLQETIDEVVADFHAAPLPELTRRSTPVPRLPGKVDAIVGMRRCGKTYLLYQVLHDLVVQGVPRERTLYVDLEDERLAPLGLQDLQLFPEALWRRFPAGRSAECWFLFDEVQNVPGWERFVRRLIDREHARVLVTGSSSRLLSKEIATSLRGRSLSTELLPFSFAEALAHAGKSMPASWPPPARERSALEHAFDDYLEVGGFPEVQRVAADLRVRILQEYVDVVVLRDVAERHGIANIPALRWLVRRLMRSPSGRFSVNRFYNELKSQGLAVGKNALHEWLGHLEDAFLVFPVERHASSLKQRAVNPKKGYLVDHGLARAVQPRSAQDLGHLLENAVYLEARRRGFSASYVVTAEGGEVDFLLERADGERMLLQVCLAMSQPATREREVGALDAAMREMGLEVGTIVTLREEETLHRDGRSIRVVPAWRWLLEPEGRSDGELVRERPRGRTIRKRKRRP